jgi:hypothetical protein
VSHSRNREEILMRHRLSCPAVPVSGPGHQPRACRLGAGAALATAAVLALAAIAPPAVAAPGARPATAASSRLTSLTVSGPAAVAGSATGRYLPRPGAGSGAVLWEQADGHRYTVPAVTAPHAGWLPASGARAAARRARAQAALRLKVTNLAGQPASNVQVVLVNTDNAALDPGPLSVTGTARVSVPAGDYSLFALFLDVDAAGNAVAFHCVFRSDFRVAAAGATVTIPERSATSPISVSTPRQAGGVDLETTFFRDSKVGGGTGTGLILGPPYLLPTYISPQPAAKVGSLRYLERWSGAGSSGRYWYDTAFAFPDIPASEHFVVRGSQVAVIHEHFFTDALAPGLGLWMTEPCDPAVLCGGYSNAVPLVNFSAPQLVDMPGNLTDYVDTASGDQWVSAVQTPNFIYLVADPQTLLAGHSYSVDWAHGPLAAGFGQHSGPWQCQACTAGRVLSLNFNSLGDSDPSHFMPPVQDQRLEPHAHFTLYRDGTKLVSAGKASGAVVGIPAGPASYRAVVNVNLTHDAGFSQSTQSHTVLTVRYAPGTESALPAGDICAQPAPAVRCRILPVLTLDYQLATSEANTSNTATQVLHLRVGHLSYNGAGSHAAIRSAAVWVSFDGGKFWRRATVTGSDGRYTATWPNPAAAALTSPDIMVTASDAIGGSITQTVTSAYTIASVGDR